MARLRRLAMALGGGAGADLGGVLGEGDIAEVVQRLDTPVPPDPVGQAGGVSLGGGEAGDRVHLTVRQRRPCSGRIRRVSRMAWVAWGSPDQRRW